MVAPLCLLQFLRREGTNDLTLEAVRLRIDEVGERIAHMSGTGFPANALGNLLRNS